MPVAHHSHRLGDGLPIPLPVPVNFLKILDDVDFSSSLAHLAQRSPSQTLFSSIGLPSFEQKSRPGPEKLFLRKNWKKTWQLWFCQVNIGKTMSLQNFQPDVLLKSPKAAKQAELCYAGKGNVEAWGKRLIFTTCRERSSNVGSSLAGQAAAGLRFTGGRSPHAATQRDAGSLHPMARRGVMDKVATGSPHLGWHQTTSPCKVGSVSIFEQGRDTNVTTNPMKYRSAAS